MSEPLYIEFTLDFLKLQRSRIHFSFHLGSCFHLSHLFWSHLTTGTWRSSLSWWSLLSNWLFWCLSLFLSCIELGGEVIEIVGHLFILVVLNISNAVYELFSWLNIKIENKIEE
jgi:hypothetical protein